MSAIRFADGSPADELELHYIALSFGFQSWEHMRQIFAERDRDRAAAKTRRRAS